MERNDRMVIGRLIVVGLMIAIPIAACEPVPDLRFVGDDASISADGSPDFRGEAGADGAADGATRDARPDPTDAEDSSNPPVCGLPKPDLSAICCGSTWCAGGCDAASCAECESLKCGAGEVCCRTGGGGNPMGKLMCKWKCN